MNGRGYYLKSFEQSYIINNNNKNKTRKTTKWRSGGEQISVFSEYCMCHNQVVVVVMVDTIFDIIVHKEN